MKLDFKKLKGLIIEKTKEIATDYGKVIGAAIVVITLFVICGITLGQRIVNSKMPSGIMMTVSGVAADEEPFSGNTFYVDGITYSEMVNKTYEADSIAQLEKTENDIDAILAARQEERQEKAAREALIARQEAANNSTTTSYEYQGTPTEIVVPTSSPSGTPNTEITYADANGSYVSLGEFELTAYCPCPICCGIYSNMTNPTTASGTRATQGRTIATDTSVIPFGSKVVINGQIYTAEDTGSAIKGKRIDIFFESHTEALYFGRQKAQVFLAQ